MLKKLISIILFFCLLLPFSGCSNKPSSSIVVPKTPIEHNEIAWIAPELMPYPIVKEWNEIQDENKHLYIRGARPYSTMSQFTEFNQLSSQIPQSEIDILTRFAEEYHHSFLKNQFASTNYGYNISYFDSALISIPFTFLSNYGGASPEDLVSIMNFDIQKQKALRNQALFTPYHQFLRRISTICFLDLQKQFTEFDPSTPKEYIEYVSSQYDLRLLKQGTDPQNPQNFEHIAIVPNGILVFFLSENISKEQTGIWEVFIPTDDIASFCTFTIDKDAYSEIVYPSHWTMYSGDGSFIIYHPITPVLDPEQAPSNIQSSVSEDHTSGMVNLFIPVSFSSSQKNNFSSAEIQIQWSKSTPFEIPEELSELPTKEEIVDGVPFISYEYSDVAAGNIYDIKTYIGSCIKIHYQIQFILHSTQISNYDPGTVELFSKEEVYKALNEVFASFSFR